MRNDLKINYIYFFPGLFFILYIVYIRVIIVRLPRDLHLYINDQLNTKLLIIIIIGLCISLQIIAFNLFLLLHKQIRENIISANLTKIKSFMDKALFEVYLAITFLMSNNYTKMSTISKKFYVIFGNITEGLFIYITYFVRFVLVFIFMFDVFYFFELNYFYKSLIFLCIPLSINVLLFMLNDFANNLNDAKSYLNIENLGIDKETNLPIIEYSPSQGNEDINLDYHIEQYLLCLKLKGYLDVYNIVLQYYSIRCNIIIYSLYFFCWLFIIYKNICMF